VPIEHELVRHAASGSIGTYMHAELLGTGIEYCVGHGQLNDDDGGRLLLASPSTVNVWNALPNVPIAHDAADGAPGFIQGVGYVDDPQGVRAQIT